MPEDNVPPKEATHPDLLLHRLRQEEARLEEVIHEVNQALAYRNGKIDLLKELLGINDGD